MKGTHFRSTKIFRNFPCSHRQHRHDGHCAFVHGYSRSFHFEFACSELTDTNFVMDFGGLKTLKKFLEEHFDHTLLLNEDDPLLPDFRALEEKGAAKIVVLPNVGMEGTARWLFYEATKIIDATENGRVWITQIEVRENDKNSAIFIAPTNADE